MSEQDDQLEHERRALERIQQVHRAHIDRAKAVAHQLADEAAVATEDGIRDLVDEDGEVDAAIRAALVRQSADAAMHAIRRSTELEAMGEALAFGYTVDADRRRLDVGRLTVIDDGEPLLVDWRAPAAVPFYRATAIDRLGVTRRRHLLYGRSGDDGREELVGYSDEVFDVDELQSDHGLRGEAAILAALDRPTDEQMRSVVATIQAEQDAVIRAPSDGALVVQGGPGTGKTVVALHRAAYLLYDRRAALSDTGVLIVGPSSEFLTYLSGVLPSLGESGVISVTAPELYPGVRRGRPEPDDVAEIKGRAVMADLLAKAVLDRQRRPLEPLQTWYGSRRVVLDAATLQAVFDRSRRHRAHNEGAAAFRAGVIESLALAVHDPSFATMDDAIASFRASRRVRHQLLRHWPTLTPEQALNDLFGSRALLALAARGLGLTQQELTALARKRTPEVELGDRRWSDADIALLDELYHLLGPVVPDADDDLTRRDELDEFEVAQQIEAAATAEADETPIDLDDEEFSFDRLDDPYLDEPTYESFGDDGRPDLRGFTTGGLE